MGKYVDDVAARSALETVARHADGSSEPLPFVWSGASWTTPGGEWRDFPLVRRGIGEWLRVMADVCDSGESHGERREALRLAILDHKFSAFHAADPTDKEWHAEEAGRLTRELDAIPALAAVAPAVVQRIRDVASELLSASDVRAKQLLSLASQFDAFRAPMDDPAAWVRRLGSAPHNVHVRTSAVWEAFAVAEPVLARSMGARAGKSALFDAMDKRFGARRKLAGYEGWRGVTLPQ
ncbi:hypothetical protein H3146_18670 [Streptomyces sp. OF3]|uniref:Uncharacterized protein n=1 Tax=Streptomyces alkaliterrae TaxID=2213162 RepID=A0A7W3WN28_9ACTN|nr:hypothetical protein [Streptomyces alkaliterrae]MBB1255363.1 hypothetical protein [Streptomyces alkaliterrae]